MRTRHLPIRAIALATGASLIALLSTGCNKQPGAPAGGAPTVAPPIAALPLSAEAGPVAPAPIAASLPPAALIPYAPPPPRQGYRYIDHAYFMGQAFADTPPDYAVDYQGTRPWIWRARNGAYRIVERLPQGERDYYYEPGQEQPFLVRDPDYSYAYEGGELVEVYAPDGAELDRAEAARRADEASRYFSRARSLYRAAQYDQRQSAYASEWAMRRNQISSAQSSWGADQSRNADWRAWHDQHAADEQRQWREEQVQRTAYAAAIGAMVSPSGPAPDPRQLASRQAAYFSSWNGQHGQTQPSVQRGTAPAPAGGSTAPPVQSGQQARVAAPSPPVIESRSPALVEDKQAAALAAQAKLAQAKAAQAGSAQHAAAATAAMQARDAQAKASEAAAEASAQQAKQAQQAAAEARQHQAAAAQAKSADEVRLQQQKAQAQQREAAAAEARSAQAAHAQQAAAQVAAANAKEAQARASEAAHAQQLANAAKQREAAAGQARNAEVQHAQQAAAQASQHQAAAAQAKPADAPHGPPPEQAGKPAPQGDKGKAPAKNPKDDQSGKDHHPDQQQ